MPTTACTRAAAVRQVGAYERRPLAVRKTAGRAVGSTAQVNVEPIIYKVEVN